jgi:hypothetical protein
MPDYSGMTSKGYLYKGCHSREYGNPGVLRMRAQIQIHWIPDYSGMTSKGYLYKGCHSLGKGNPVRNYVATSNKAIFSSQFSVLRLTSFKTSAFFSDH